MGLNVAWMCEILGKFELDGASNFTLKIDIFVLGGN